MTAKNAIDIADAMVDTINAATLSQSVVAERLYAPAFDLRDMATLHVSVVPRTSIEEPRTRVEILETIEIDVAVQQRIGGADPDALMQLTDEIVDLFRFGRLTAPECRNVQVDRVLFDRETLEKRKLFQSLATFRFELVEC